MEKACFTFVEETLWAIIGVRDLVARGYSIPGGASQRGGWPGSDVSVSHVVGHCQGSGFEGLGLVPLGPKRARQRPLWSRMGLYISRTPIRDSRMIRRGSSGPDGPPEGPWGRRGVPRGSVHQSCTDTGQSSDPSSPMGPVVPKQGSDGNPSERGMARRNLTSPDGSLDCPVSVYD